MPLVHISDLTTFFTQLVKAILREEKLPTGYEGYYFTVSHRVHWWDILDRLARALHASGLVKEPTTQVWPSDEVAAGVLGVPKEFAHSIWDSG